MFLLPDAVNILFGMHLLDEATAMSLHPLTTVVYNLEQLGGSWTPPWYLGLAQRYQVWDFSTINLQVWHSVPRCCKPQRVEVAYVPELTRFQSHAEQPVDVFFYGSLNDRRTGILQRLIAGGIQPVCGTGLYGVGRDAVIASSKLILNLHAHPQEIFEAVRVSYLLANSKAVVSENSPDIGYFADAVALADPDTIAEVCRELLANDEKRRVLEQRGFQVFSQHSLLDSLAVAIAAYV